MQQLMYRMVERMLTDRGSFSRNKNFEAFNDPRLGRATRIVRHLRSLQNDLLLSDGAGGVKVEVEGHKVRLEIARPEVRSVRVAYINRDELSLMCLNPRIRTMMEGLLGPEWFNERPVQSSPRR